MIKGRRLITLLCVAGLIVASACGGGDDDKSAALSEEGAGDATQDNASEQPADPSSDPLAWCEAALDSRAASRVLDVPVELSASSDHDVVEFVCEYNLVGGRDGGDESDVDGPALGVYVSRTSDGDVDRVGESDGEVVQVGGLPAVIPESTDYVWVVGPMWGAQVEIYGLPEARGLALAIAESLSAHL